MIINYIHYVDNESPIVNVKILGLLVQKKIFKGQIIYPKHNLSVDLLQVLPIRSLCKSIPIHTHTRTHLTLS